MEKEKWENVFTFQPSSPPKDQAKPPPPPNHKLKYKRNSTSRNPEEARQKRIEIDNEARRRHREQLITDKRFKLHPDAWITDEAEPEFELTSQEIAKLKHGLNNTNRELRLQSLIELSKYLVDPPDALKDFVLEGDCIQILIKFLSGVDSEEQLQATWCITNIAAGSKEFCQKALPTVPYLISLLDCQNIALQDQASWAIGNIAIEGPECRDLLRANGVLIPLIRLLDTKDVNLVQTVCFALSNLARGPNAPLDEFFAAGVSNILLRHLANHSMEEAVSEVAWVLTYLTSGDEKYSTRLLKEDLAPLLVKHMRPLLNKGPLSLPLIRTLGNIASGPDDHTDILIQQADFFPAMFDYIQSDCRAVKKESLWVMSNVTAARRPEVLKQVIDANFIPILASIATHTNFDIRKEAAYSLVNIAHHGEEYMRPLPHEELLPGFLEFIRSQDVDLIRLGLGYIQLLLKQVPEGKNFLEQHNGIDAIEAVTLSEDVELRQAASSLMDEYFGEIEMMEENA